jgi:NAD(P)H-nitrite reductase large subunit
MNATRGFINDRVHANIQKNGTFSVVPRIYGGVTTAEELMRIATVAVKFNVPLVKLTGGQRIDLLGIKKEDLPYVWKELGMRVGHAYTKAFRTCKSCVGTDFCRYGVGDSIALAQKIEYRFQGVESPHKMKLATAGCPRNCSEAYVKDLGAVAIEGGKWEIYVGGGAGGTVRKGDLLCTVETHDDVLLYMGRFMQYYRAARQISRADVRIRRNASALRRYEISSSKTVSESALNSTLKSKKLWMPTGTRGRKPNCRPIPRSSAGPNLLAHWRSLKTMAKVISTCMNLGTAHAIPVGQGRCYVVEGQEIAVFRQRDGKLFATQNLCPASAGATLRGPRGKWKSDLPPARTPL